jgi:hypothetical protein
MKRRGLALLGVRCSLPTLGSATIVARSRVERSGCVTWHVEGPFIDRVDRERAAVREVQKSAAFHDTVVPRVVGVCAAR